VLHGLVDIGSYAELRLKEFVFGKLIDELCLADTMESAPDVDIRDTMSLRLCHVKNEVCRAGEESGLAGTKVDGHKLSWKRIAGL
jgi:hypothetical protein